jgi:uncharacterized protein involved in exopolysaccharide biosynthesis
MQIGLRKKRRKIPATQAEISRLKGELATVENLMAEYLKELGF